MGGLPPRPTNKRAIQNRSKWDRGGDECSSGSVRLCCNLFSAPSNTDAGLTKERETCTIPVTHPASAGSVWGFFFCARVCVCECGEHDVNEQHK